MNISIKEFLAVVVSAAGAFVVALGPGGGTFGSIDTTHWLVAGGTILGSGALVKLVSNLPGEGSPIAKAIIAFLSAGIASLVIALADNVITQAEWLTAFIAAVLATGAVYEGTGTPKATRTS